jgi:hypothetical protein
VAGRNGVPIILRCCLRRLDEAAYGGAGCRREDIDEAARLDQNDAAFLASYPNA